MLDNVERFPEPFGTATVLRPFPSLPFRPLAHAGRLWSSCTLPPSLLAVAGPVSPRPNTHPRNDPAASDGTSPLANHSRAPGQRTSDITNGDSHVGRGIGCSLLMEPASAAAG